MEISKKKLSFRGFCVFMALMGILSLVSRGIYGMKLARVELGNATMAPIDHEVTGSGAIAGGVAHPVSIKEGILVEKVHLAAGARVKAGETVLTLNLEDLENKMTEVKRQLLIEETLLSDMQFNRNQADADAKKAKERAGADLEQVTEEQNALLVKAKEEYEKAVQSLNEFPTFDAYFEDVKKTDETYCKLYEESKDKNKSEAERKERKKELVTYEKTLKESAKENWEKEKLDLEAVCEATKEAYVAAENNYERQVQGAERAFQDAGQQTKDEASLLLQQNAVEMAQKEVEELQALIDAGGNIRSDYEGVVADFYLKAGDRTGEGTAFIIVDGKEDWQFCGKISGEERKYIKVGDKIRLKFPNLGLNHVEAEIISVSIQTDEMGMYEFMAKLGEEEYYYGEIGNYTLTKRNEENEENSCSIPLSALHEEMDGTYVFVIVEEKTFLGTELRAVKRKVEVSDQNAAYAQLKDSPLTADEKIIISSDKVVAPGDIVREHDPG